MVKVIPKIVCNSSPLINLAKIGCLDLIENIYQQVVIPTAVYNELILQGTIKKGVSEIEDLIDRQVLVVKEVTDRSLVKALNKDLDLGESEAIALALSINANLIIIDEVDARRLADIYKLKKTGFIGVLIRAKKEGHINAVKEYIDNAIKEGFWLNKNLYETIIDKLNE
jgi:uncharacterized protein